jgi:membrane protease YdiL (CAAX protease family)
MVDQLTSAETCRKCGASLIREEFPIDGLCRSCARGIDSQATEIEPAGLASNPIDFISESRPVAEPDPDEPPWGPFTGISVWLVSVAAIIIIPVIAIALWLVIQTARGAPLPNFTARDEVEQWVMSPNILLLQIVSTIVAHALTLAICWAVVTKMGSRPFRASLGWSWGGHRVWYWVVFSGCTLLGIQILSQVLIRFLPERESPFDQLLKSSQQVRIAVAILAVFTAPIVEEVVYRGLLFSALRKRIGVIATVIIVTATFAGVHVFQNRGAWVSISGLAFLSLALTMVRAKTKSVLPCVFIHTLNNAFASLVILINKGS